MKGFFSIITIFLFISISQAQNLKYNLAYFGETFTHPGLKLCVEQTLFLKNRGQTVDTISSISERYQIFSTYNVACYHRWQTNATILIYPEIAYRYTMKKGFFWEATTAIGYLRTFYTDETFSVDENGTISKIPFAGRNGFIYLISVGFGDDISKTKIRNPIKWYVKPTLYWQYPYNGYWLRHFSLDLGIKLLFGSK